MTQLESAATWQPRTRPSAAGRLAKAAGIGLVVLVLSQYLAGYAFLWSIGAAPFSATPFTIARYSYYFGDRPAGVEAPGPRGGYAVAGGSFRSFTTRRRCTAMRASRTGARLRALGSFRRADFISAASGVAI